MMLAHPLKDAATVDAPQPLRHSLLAGKTPARASNECKRQRADATNYRWQSHCGGLFMLPVAA